VPFDIFFSISQTPVDGHTPSEAEMFRNFFRQVEAADRQGYGVAWVAESHLSSEVQKGNRKPVIPHWQGEVGLNGNLPQLASYVFGRTRRIEVGAAVMNIVTMGGPLAAAEKIASMLALHGMDASERRRLHVGFSAGRFEYMNEATGVVARDAVEAAAWPVVKSRVFWEATEIFLRALRGDTFSSDDLPSYTLDRSSFWPTATCGACGLRFDAPSPKACKRCGSADLVVRDETWERVSALAGGASSIPIARRWTFEKLKIIPQDWRRELLQLVIGSHEPALQEHANTLLPVQVFNLSITQPAVIEDTHRRMATAYHPAGGPWQRGYMPRTSFCFVNGDPGLTPTEQRARAQADADAALGAYWTALEGTLDPRKVENAATNALIGSPGDVAAQIRERFHPDDRLMLWFDFFDHDCDRVIQRQQDFMDRVVPLLGGR
jgi:alkanesulfonate monooxygenase SsuD/methylene tetrahydromethanopterin reductase-like flavin-dependent oxidoreductase (luciferase family)